MVWCVSIEHHHRCHAVDAEGHFGVDTLADFDRAGSIVRFHERAGFLKCPIGFEMDLIGHDFNPSFFQCSFPFLANARRKHELCNVRKDVLHGEITRIAELPSATIKSSM